MKKVLLSFLIAAGICTLLNSCSSGDYNANPNGSSGATNQLYTGGGSNGGSNNGGTSGTNTFTATLNGSSFNSIYTTATDTLGSLVIQGVSGTNSSNGKIIDLEPIGYNGTPGTFTVGTNAEIVYLSTASSTPIPATSGEIVITSVNGNNIQGTFSASASGLTITNGKFNVYK